MQYSHEAKQTLQTRKKLQAMLADFFGQKCGHLLSKERISIPWSQQHELFNLG
jgi:hypothetical protein